MTDSVTIAAIATYIATNTPAWLQALQGTLLEKGKQVAIDKGTEFATTRSTSFIRSILHLDEKEQHRHLKLALKNAIERGLVRFKTPQERDQYTDVLEILFEPGLNSDMLRREALGLFSLSDTPDLISLNEAYNQSLRIRSQPSSISQAEVDAAPYLISFFDALIAELYADSFFKQQISDVLKVRASRTAIKMQRSLVEVVAVLHEINERLAEDYTTEQFEQDIARYTTHIERAFRYLKLVGVVPKERVDKLLDPELNSIFVPLRIAFQTNVQPQNQVGDSLVDTLKEHPYLVLLGGPGSGKSTALRHFAWSHACFNKLEHSIPNYFILPSTPLPLYIELRRLSEERRQHPGYNFLSYATEVLLGREHVEINLQMFEELLERKTMLILFDGLDEVATMEERKRLIEEIERFALHYPGNYIIITTRPVGYDLTRFSDQWFIHAYIQDFNDNQIKQFLNHWYTRVLRLSPISYEDQQELESLFSTLKKNIRLHKLAENPLLLTVLTALHRYERLPDRRALIYDRCADLLLETWAKLKGTDARWKDLKLVKEDQYACVAHLGFVLHERSQAERSKRENTVTDISSDVTTRVMLREIENFLKNGNLITEVAERRAQAKLFIELMKVEAGLIVERGTEESGESLYGFVHRTFQEYFAAADIYERYLQEEDPTIISAFLKEHLHETHWREVILLLLSKLKSRPVTNQLRQILQGKIRSRRSQFTSIVQQDLFFVCDCLINEILVGNDLVEAVVLCLSNIVKDSPFPSQRTKALETLADLMYTHQCRNSARRELTALAIQNDMIDISTKIDAAQLLYSDEPDLFAKTLIELIQKPHISFEEIVKATQPFIYWSSVDSEEQRILPYGSEGQKLASQMLAVLAQRRDLSFEQKLLVAENAYKSNPEGSYRRKQALMMHLDLSQSPGLSVEQIVRATKIFYINHIDEPEDREQALQILKSLSQRLNLSFEETVLVAKALHSCSLNKLEQQKAVAMLKTLLPLPYLSFEQVAQVCYELYKWSSDTEDRQHVCELLLNLSQRSDISCEQVIRFSEAIYQRYSVEGERTVQVALDLEQQPGFSAEKARHPAEIFYNNALIELKEWQEVARRMLLRIMHQSPLESSFQGAMILYRYGTEESQERQLAKETLLTVIENSALPVEQVIQAAHVLHLYSSVMSKERNKADRVLLEKAQQTDLTIEQRAFAAQILFKDSSFPSAERLQAIRILLDFIRQQDVPVEQKVRIAEIFYEKRIYISLEEREEVAEQLWQLIENPYLSAAQRLSAVKPILATDNLSYVEKVKAVRAINTILQEDEARRFISQHLRQAINPPSSNFHMPILFIVQQTGRIGRDTTIQLEKENMLGSGRTIYAEPDVKLSDILYIAELAQQESMPSLARDQMYRMLDLLVPQFNEIPPV